MTATLLAACVAPPEVRPAPTGGGGTTVPDTAVADTGTDPPASIPSTPAPAFLGWTRAGTGLPGSEALAITPLGELFASWVVEGPGGGDVAVARSVDGASFEAAVLAESGELGPTVSTIARPWIAADGARVAIVFDDAASGWSVASVAWVMVADAASLTFGAPTPAGEALSGRVDYARPAFAPDGDLWVAFQGKPLGADEGIFVARESAGFAPEAASEGAPGVPCECCPLDFGFDDGDAARVAYRNNDVNHREIWVARASTGGLPFDGWTEASRTEGRMASCPLEGPRLAARPGAGSLLVWRSLGDTHPGAVLGSSSDDGISWSAAVVIDAFEDARDPSLAAGLSGVIFVVGLETTGAARLATSADDGATWTSAGTLVPPEGDPLISAQLAQGGGRVALAGTTFAGAVWVLTLE